MLRTMRAARARNAIEIERYLEMDRRWFSLARSREYAERVGQFVPVGRVVACLSNA